MSKTTHESQLAGDAKLHLPAKVVALADFRQSTRQDGDLQLANPAHAQLLPFPKTAHVRHSKAQRVAGLPTKAARAQGLNRKSKTRAPAERVSKAECHAGMRARIEAVGRVLNLSAAEIKPAMSLKHEHVGTFAQKCGLKLDWLIAGYGCAFRSRGELFELAVEYEMRLKAEKLLGSEKSRLWNVCRRLSYEKIGADPDNRANCDAVRNANHKRWEIALDDAGRESGYDAAWDRYNKASKRTNRVARRIFDLAAPTSKLGILIRLRVIQTNDGAFRKPPEKMMMEEITRFLRGVSPAGAPPVPSGS